MMNILLPRRESVFTPYDMPTYLHTSGGIVLHIPVSGNTYAANTGGFYASAISTSGFTNTFIATAYTANTFYTIVDIVGKGRFAGAISNTNTSTTIGSTSTLRITIDGKIYTITRTNTATNSGFRVVIGYYATVGNMGIDPDTSVRQATATLYSSYWSPNPTQPGTLIRLSNTSIIEKFYDQLPKFKNSLKVETSCNLSSSSFDSYASCLYMLE